MPPRSAVALAGVADALQLYLKSCVALALALAAKAAFNAARVAAAGAVAVAAAACCGDQGRLDPSAAAVSSPAPPLASVLWPLAATASSSLAGLLLLAYCKRRYAVVRGRQQKRALLLLLNSKAGREETAAQVGVGLVRAPLPAAACCLLPPTCCHLHPTGAPPTSELPWRTHCSTRHLLHSSHNSAACHHHQFHHHLPPPRSLLRLQAACEDHAAEMQPGVGSGGKAHRSSSDSHSSSNTLAASTHLTSGQTTTTVTTADGSCSTPTSHMRSIRHPLAAASTLIHANLSSTPPAVTLGSTSRYPQPCSSVCSSCSNSDGYPAAADPAALSRSATCHVAASKPDQAADAAAEPAAARAAAGTGSSSSASSRRVALDLAKVLAAAAAVRARGAGGRLGAQQAAASVSKPSSLLLYKPVTQHRVCSIKVGPETEAAGCGLPVLGCWAGCWLPSKTTACF
jgi:hypothetical protein